MMTLDEKGQQQEMMNSEENEKTSQIQVVMPHIQPIKGRILTNPQIVVEGQRKNEENAPYRGYQNINQCFSVHPR